MKTPRKLKPPDLPQRWGLLEVNGWRVTVVVHAEQQADRNRDEENLLLFSAIRRHQDGHEWTKSTARFTAQSR